jgi:hypothetical protein
MIGTWLSEHADWICVGIWIAVWLWGLSYLVKLRLK